MSEAIWLPALVVLLAGLGLGALLAIRLRGTGTRQTTNQTFDIDLKISDLEERRDDLYRRLQAANEEGLGPEESSALEEAAALTLRDLDQLRQQLPAGVEKDATISDKTSDKPATRRGASATEDSDQRPRKRRQPLLAGVAFGATMMLVIALLVYWAVQDAQPTVQQPMQADSSMEPPHEAAAAIPPELATQIADLQQHLVANPQDWPAKKQLSLSYVAAGQFFEAFGEASQLLQQFPDDPDGLLVHGIVRLTMSQAEQSVDLLDRVLAQHPDHRQALIYRGLALYQLGRVEQAMDTWEMGLELTGGNDPEFQELIQMARTGASRTAGMMAPPSPPPAAASTSVPSAPAAPQVVDPDGFPLQIAIASNVQLAPQATLFVYLRPTEGGPPVAARRIQMPRFPLAITLDTEDSMMGAELPESGVLVVRLDTDGSVSTTTASDLQIESPAIKGELTRLTLGR